MRLIGMLDSPYVRRVAIAFRFMGLAFDHESVSVFRHYADFRAINPLVKAPTLVCADGTVLMDSTLILDYADTLVAPAQRLMPADGARRLASLQQVAVALAAMEKTVQVYYEETLRPADKRHEPWHDRVSEQMRTAFLLLEAMPPASGWLDGQRPMQPDVSIAVAWTFVQFILPGRLDPDKHPRLAAFAARAEALPEFIAAPLQ